MKPGACGPPVNPMWTRMRRASASGGSPSSGTSHPQEADLVVAGREVRGQHDRPRHRRLDLGLLGHDLLSAEEVDDCHAKEDGNASNVAVEVVR